MSTPDQKPEQPSDPQAPKDYSAWIIAAVIVAVLTMAIVGRVISNADKSSPSAETTEDPCEMPESFEVDDDFNTAPADEYFERCYDAIADQLNE